MRRKKIALVAAIAAAAVSMGVAGPAAAAQPDDAALRRAIAGLPSADATAAQVRVGGADGHWTGASGQSDIHMHRAVHGNERFRAGSVTKVFTAAVVLQLVHEHKLDLKGTVQQYLPGLLPADYPEVRVEQLLNYTSGLPGGDTGGRFTTWDHRKLVQAGFTQGMEFQPGTQQHYSNIGYNVLGLLIEKATGRSYEQELRDRVLKPLQLKDTYSPGNATGIRGPHTHGYQVVKDKDGTTHLEDVTAWDQSCTWASGDLITTTADLERFMTALFKGRVVPQPELELMFTVPDVPMYGGGKAAYTSGLTRMTIGDKVVYGKTGARYGYQDGIGATRDLSRTLVYSVNATDAKGEEGNVIVGKIIKAGFGDR
ncbi:beta-lactamase family protein [Streptomyces sp. ET3-23]|uniref:serine hydrolase domain-containing protein n=1 Tax=Streptomyces sp. ET3-23 TaxID=2885643 RepID=UPI001D12ED72|nr:serine hydrolase domain-containing protein [Streptomyces sp. ET3-23]MCC2278558.1 beta-lactamase family protein [Streptomyces sp. ET3-23]